MGYSAKASPLPGARPPRDTGLPERIQQRMRTVHDRPPPDTLRPTRRPMAVLGPVGPPGPAEMGYWTGPAPGPPPPPTLEQRIWRHCEQEALREIECLVRGEVYVYQPYQEE